jgi:hypothetical protein
MEGVHVVVSVDFDDTLSRHPHHDKAHLAIVRSGILKLLESDVCICVVINTFNSRSEVLAHLDKLTHPRFWIIDLLDTEKSVHNTKASALAESLQSRGVSIQDLETVEHIDDLASENLQLMDWLRAGFDVGILKLTEITSGVLFTLTVKTKDAI